MIVSDSTSHGICCKCDMMQCDVIDRKAWEGGYLLGAMSSPLCDKTAIENLEQDSIPVDKQVMTSHSCTANWMISIDQIWCIMMILIIMYSILFLVYYSFLTRLEPTNIRSVFFLFFSSTFYLLTCFQYCIFPFILTLFLLISVLSNFLPLSRHPL